MLPPNPPSITRVLKAWWKLIPLYHALRCYFTTLKCLFILHIYIECHVVYLWINLSETGFCGIWHLTPTAILRPFIIITRCCLLMKLAYRTPCFRKPKDEKDLCIRLVFLFLWDSIDIIVCSSWQEVLVYKLEALARQESLSCDIPFCLLVFYTCGGNTLLCVFHVSSGLNRREGMILLSQQGFESFS